MTDVPRLKVLDAAVPLLRQGYPFIQKTCRGFNSDIFSARLMGERALFITGSEAAKILYSDRFRRRGAAPGRIVKGLFGKGGVQQLDGPAHHHRKRMLMSLMTRQRLDELLEILDTEWEQAFELWEGSDRVVLLDATREVLARAACAWAGMPVDDLNTHAIARDVSHAVEGFASIGPKWWLARAGRVHANAWAKQMIAGVRSGLIHPPEGSAARVIAEHRQLDGSPLPLAVAAVELLNVIRPIVAIGRYIVFEALSLHDHHEYRERLQRDDQLVEWFVQEVRRLAPFTPFVGGRVDQEFEWRGVRFERDTLVLLDVYGTHRDPRIWADPEAFLPERFEDWGASPFELLAQGGGTFDTGHRCAGEWLTIEVMKQALVQLTRALRYELPAQDLSVDLSKIPAGPKSGVVLRSVERTLMPRSAYVRAARGSEAGSDGARQSRNIVIGPPL